MVKLSYEKRLKLKNQIKEALMNSTSHCIPNIVGSENAPIKILWILFTLISAILCAYLIIENVINYFNYEVTTTIRVKYEMNSTFPSVTLCNYNFFTTEYAKKFIDNQSNETEKSEEMIDYIQKALLYSNNMNELKKFGDSLNNLIKDYKFDRERHELSDEFTYYFHPFYGNCYMFNSAKYENGSSRSAKKTIKIGILSGLSLVLNISIYPQLEIESRGAVVFVHEFGTSPLTTDPITTSPRYQTNIALQRTRSIQMPKPYSDCDEGTNDPEKYDSEYFKAVHNTSFKYSRKLCLDMCFHRLILAHCSCYLFSLSMSIEGKACMTKNDYQCVTNYYFDFIKSDYFSTHCIPKCPLECNSLIYSKTTSTLLESIHLEKFQNESTVVIYFEDFRITEIEESEVMDLVILLSNIGGVAGLFLGVSFLSLMECFAIMVEILQILLTKKRKRNLTENTVDKCFIEID